MPIFRVMKNDLFGEGYREGDLVPFDWQAAKVRVENGELVYVREENPKDIPPTREEITHKNKLDNLTDAKSVLDKLKITFWLEAGTCLGAVREGNFIEYDTDIDLGVLAEDEHRADEIIQAMKQKGFEVMYEWGERGKGYEISFIRFDVKLDLFFFYKKGDKRWHGAYYHKELIPHIFDAKLIEKLKTIDFQGLKVKIPFASKKYIVARYGEDWETPNKDWHYWEDPKCIDKTFVC